jgi:hypothetical protein
MPVVGSLNFASTDGYRPMVTAFHQGLSETGYIEGRNVLMLNIEKARLPHDSLARSVHGP